MLCMHLYLYARHIYSCVPVKRPAGGWGGGGGRIRFFFISGFFCDYSKLVANIDDKFGSNYSALDWHSRFVDNSLSMCEKMAFVT